MTISKNTSSAKQKSNSSSINKNSKPDRATLRSYQMGFGDCFLLTFHYGAEARHILIDFGSTGKPDDAPPDLMLQVANDIKERCGGKLHIVVATHRHKDHISGFATNEEETASGDIIRQCDPDLVIQPWTEDPNAPVDATNSVTISRENKADKKIAFSKTLGDMQTVAEMIKAVAEKIRREARTQSGSREMAALADQLEFLGDDNISNRSAIENLIKMSKLGRGRYVSADLEKPWAELNALLPGVKVWVLGPPNLEQSKKITKMRSSDAAEFWQLSADAGKAVSRNQSKPLFPHVATRAMAHLMPPHTRWFIRRMDSMQGTQMLEIVRILDSVMNNTSVILLFEVGGKKLLFPGDAQIENWSYALDRARSDPAFKKLLEDVDVFKVGHHGSRNANPKSLWEMFKKRNSSSSEKRLQTFVSTMEGKHGNSEKKTEVPRISLVEALQAESDYFSTQQLEKGQLGKDFPIPFQ